MIALLLAAAPAVRHMYVLPHPPSPLLPLPLSMEPAKTQEHQSMKLDGSRASTLDCSSQLADHWLSSYESYLPSRWAMGAS